MTIRLAGLIVGVIILFSGCQRDSINFVNGVYITYRHDLKVGASAKDLLAAEKYKSLTVEIQYLSENFKPNDSVIAHFISMLEASLNKPEGITVIQKQIKPSQVSFGINQIRSIEQTNRTAFTEGQNLSIYVLYLNGYYSVDSLVLGAAYRNTSIVIFGKSIIDYSSGNDTKKQIFDATVLEHEFAHLLGLVGEATPVQSDHKDDANGNHCRNSNCLMYFAFMDTYHSSQYINGLKSVPIFDSACIADLRVISGK